MGKKDATVSRLPVDQYRKEIGKQDYKKTKPALRAARLKAEAKRNAPGIRIMQKCTSKNVADPVHCENLRVNRWHVSRCARGRMQFVLS
uniref:Triple QxxK/R motif-containing protein n=1 Tax=Scleropages formosus TaxID=113540 RepID=A0A8C9VU77_SCLFO